MLRKNHVLRVFETVELKKLPGPKEGEVKGGGKIICIINSFMF
jgi:hypothetical protein